MKARAVGALVLWGLVFRVPLAHAQRPAPFHAEPRCQLAADVLAGVSTGPYLTVAFPETTAYGAALTLQGRFRWDRRFSLSARVPLVYAGLQQPAGAFYDEATWGNPELSGALDLLRRKQNGWTVDLTTHLALGIPIAEHDGAQLAGRALALADALEGFGEPELFTPGILPFIPAAQLLFSGQDWRFGASLKLPLLARVSDASLPSASAARSLGVVPVAELSARVQLLPWLAVAAAPRLAVRAVSSVEDHAQALQLTAIGQAEFRLARTTSAAAVVQAPLGGALGGSTLAGGLTVRSAF